MASSKQRVCSLSTRGGSAPVQLPRNRCGWRRSEGDDGFIRTEVAPSRLGTVNVNWIYLGTFASAGFQTSLVSRDQNAWPMGWGGGYAV